MTKAQRPLPRMACLCLLAIALSGCSIPLPKLPGLPTGATPAPLSAVPTATSLPRSQSVFIAQLPEPLASGETLALALLDEVTGLALNAQLYPMQQINPVTYSATLALPYRAIVKYRYVRLGAAQFAEDTALDEDIRYRLFYAVGPAEVRDVVSGWSDRPNATATGSIQGRVLNADTGTPIPDILVTAAGQRCFTDSAGRFNLQGVGVGTHNLVAYAIDGTYETFQQGATVAAGLNTAVEVHLRAAALVKITFVVSAPTDVQGAPVRVAGNLVELGNTFADLRGGMSAVPERMPVMALLPDGRYSATVSLPAGAYVEYKYTLGDGFWNAEHASSGAFRLRELVVPSEDTLIRGRRRHVVCGQVHRRSSSRRPSHRTRRPQDIVSIQFNAYGWTEPIPMWPLGGNRWAYKLYGPINTLGNSALPVLPGRAVRQRRRRRNCRRRIPRPRRRNQPGGTEHQGHSVRMGMAGRDRARNAGWKRHQRSTCGFCGGRGIPVRLPAQLDLLQPAGCAGRSGVGRELDRVHTRLDLRRAPSLWCSAWIPQQEPFWLDNTIMISQARAANLNVAVFPGRALRGFARRILVRCPT